MSTNNKTSNLIDSQVPFFVRNDHPTFIRFLELYYEYLEQEGKAVGRAKNFQSYKDIDRTIDDFTDHFYDTYLKLIPEGVLADKRLLLKHVQDLYRARGTEKSVRFLMNIMFGEQDVNFYYPKKDVLKASDGKWFIQKSLRINDAFVDGTANNDLSGLLKFAKTSIKGNTSNAFAIVERVDRFFEQGAQIDELILSSIKGNFENGETVFATYVEENIVKSVRANVFGGILNAVTIVDGGAGYQVGTHPIITNETGTGANLRIDQVSTGNVASITVIDGGAGYKQNDFLLFSGGGGTGANANVFSVLNDGSVHPNSYNIILSTISSEANTLLSNATYSNLNVANANVTLNTTLSNAFTTFTYSNTGPVRIIIVRDAGTDYTGIPSISILANTRVQDLGILGRMKINDGGLNYAINDIITFTNISGGYGTGALAKVSNVAANGKITEVQFIEMPGHIIGGSGYNDSITKTPRYPIANVSTATGNGANIEVTALLGEGGSFIIANTTLGTIQRISIVDRGSGYTGKANVDLTGLGDGTANVQVSILEGVFSYPGRYLNDDGFLSSYNFLQDRDYYQNFSYVVKVKASIEKYRKALKDLLHPAGMKLFGQYTVSDMNDSMTISGGADASVNKSIKSKSYIKTGNTINVTYPSHGLSVGNEVFLEFYDGPVTNIHYNYAYSNLTNSFLSITGGTGTTANANVVVNAQGSIVAVNLLVGGNNYTLADDLFIYVLGNKPSSNLTVNTGSGATVTTLNLSDIRANSNVFLSNGFVLHIDNKVVRITSSSPTSNQITISPGIRGNLVANTFNVSPSFNYTINTQSQKANTKDGRYVVTNANSADHFEVVARRSGIKTLTIVNTGSGYNANSHLVFSSENGKSANGFFTVNANGAIVSVDIRDYGMYYSSAPTVTANGSNTTAASFIVTLNHYANNAVGNANVSILI